jgi:hypothetical protein
VPFQFGDYGNSKHPDEQQRWETIAGDEEYAESVDFVLSEVENDDCHCCLLQLYYYTFYIN